MIIIYQSNCGLLFFHHKIFSQLRNINFNFKIKMTLKYKKGENISFLLYLPTLVFLDVNPSVDWYVFESFDLSWILVCISFHIFNNLANLCSSPRKEKYSKYPTGKYVVPHKQIIRVNPNGRNQGGIPEK